MTPTPVFIGAEIYRHSTYGSWHPLSIPRVSTAMDLSRALGWLNRTQYRTSPRAKAEALTLWHDPGYLEALQAAEAAGDVSDEVRKRYNLGTLSNPVFAEMFRRPATAAGGSMLAGALLAEPGIVYHPAGGTHHGLRDRANGFCYLNDPVLAMLSLRRAGIHRLAYIDIDAHHCDGVETAFAGDPDILMVSVHEERRWPFTGALEDTAGGSSLNLPVPRGFNDSEMALIREDLILPALETFVPDAIVVQCGADAVEEDPLSRLALSNNAHWEFIAAIQPFTDRFLVLGGGGYNPWTVGRLWAGVWATMNGFEIPHRLPETAIGIQRELSWRGKPRAPEPSQELLTTLRDAPRLGNVRQDIRDRIAVLRTRFHDLLPVSMV
ncbi:MAG: acetoin utilization protein AcuC [Dinoroseobacter sp.]|nr:acetoin utilization protein AcuC [Dinoroseobacter sp.]